MNILYQIDFDTIFFLQNVENKRLKIYSVRGIYLFFLVLRVLRIIAFAPTSPFSHPAGCTSYR